MTAVQSGWGRATGSHATSLVVSEPCEVVGAFSRADRRGVLARGLGRSYGDAAQNAGGTLLDCTALNGIRLDAERGRASFRAGTSIDEALRFLVPRGWFVPVTPGTRFVTIGGAIAADVHGKNHHVDGSIGDHVTSLDLALPSGEVRTLRPDGDDPAFWATVGGMGLTGVVLEATLDLVPIETATMKVDTERTRDIEETLTRMAAHDRHRYSVAWIDLLARGRSLGRAVLTSGDHARLDDLPAAARARASHFDPRQRLAAPPWVPTGVLRPSTVRAFNEAWFRRAPAHEEAGLEPISTFFHPLDGVRDWNRIYGRHGFVQHQFVVPHDATRELVRIVEVLSDARCPSFLTVLKRFGPGHGMLSFPMAGWTLAIDVPAAVRGLGPLLDRVDRMVVDAGGRIYLAKDARVDPELVPRMYPELDQWRAVRDSLDPDGVMRSDLARRLGLC